MDRLSIDGISIAVVMFLFGYAWARRYDARTEMGNFAIAVALGSGVGLGGGAGFLFATMSPGAPDEDGDGPSWPGRTWSG